MGLNFKKKYDFVEKVCFTFFVIGIISTLCMTATALADYYEVSRAVAIVAVIGFVISDATLNSFDAEIADMLREEKRRKRVE